jgi:hypothetical protein
MQTSRNLQSTLHPGILRAASLSGKKNVIEKNYTLLLGNNTNELENGELDEICGPKKDKVDAKFRKVHIEELGEIT